MASQFGVHRTVLRRSTAGWFTDVQQRASEILCRIFTLTQIYQGAEPWIQNIRAESDLLQLTHHNPNSPRATTFKSHSFPLRFSFRVRLAIAPSRQQTCESFALYSCFTVFISSTLYVVSFQNVHVFNKVTLHHQTLNRMFFHIKLLTGKKNLKWELYNLFTWRRLKMEQTVYRKYCIILMGHKRNTKLRFGN